MKLVIPKGATSRIITVFIQDSSSTTGAGLGSLTQASGIVGGYVREGGTGVALAVDEDVTTEGTYQAPSAAGKVRIGTPANMRTGTYELHFHNDLWATGAETVTITLGGAANMADLPIEVQLSDPVRGLGSPTALPNAAADAPGGLPISDAGGLDLDAIKAKTDNLPTDPADASDIAAAFAALNDLDAAGVRAAIGLAAANLDTQLADIPTVAEFNARTLAAADYFDPAADTVANVTAVGSVSGSVGSIVGVTFPTNFSALVINGSGFVTYANTAPPTAGAVADAIWDEVQSGHTTPGTFGANLDVAVSTRAEAVSSGSGAFIVTVTVDDGTDPLENVTVRLREGANNFTAITNASGVATFSLDAATYTISMTKVGYQFTPDTIVVTTAADFPESMTPITVSASAPGFSTGVLTCYDEDGVAESGVSVSVQIQNGPGTAGLAYDATVRVETSGVDGVVQFTNMVIGARYHIWRGTSSRVPLTITVPNAASFNINEIVGAP